MKKPRKVVSPTGKPITLSAVRPNVGVEVDYRKKLTALIDEMHASASHWIGAAWNKSPPVMAQDDYRSSSFVDLRKAMIKLGKQWQRRFDEAAEKLSKRFVDSAMSHTENAMISTLKDAGFALKFSMTRASSEAYQAVLQENVALIKSIPAEYLHDVQISVWQSVKAGHDRGALADELQEKYSITRRRAELIARDQNSKAKSVIENVRRQELGIEEAIWMHSHAGKHPRPSHVAADGKRYKLKEGMLIDGKHILPGQEINCRCTSKAVVPGFE